MSQVYLCQYIGYVLESKNYDFTPIDLFNIEMRRHGGMVKRNDKVIEESITT